MVSSDSILAEVKRCLFYPRVRKRIRLSDGEIGDTVSALAILATIVEGRVKIPVPCRDEQDLKYLSAALDGQAHYLVSGDGHLLEIGQWEDVRIVTPREFLAVIRKA